MADLLKAIKTIVDNPIPDLVSYYQGKNRINSIGDALECFVKDIFAETLSQSEQALKNERYSEVFSYIGNQNNPPDLILKNGDAIEVKKIESLKASIALNSSYPKSKLYYDSPLITKHCRQCEDWQEKDIIYVIGVPENKKLKILWFIYGDCYAADREIYERIAKKISSGITEIKDVEFSETRELGRVNKVDPLGITYLRIRGMWGITNPIYVYDYIFQTQATENLQVVVIMKEEKYLSFSPESREEIEAISNVNFQNQNVNIRDPNNPAQLLRAKIFIYRI
ncbi:NgoPII family restriction endonuclease [Brasilonema bromeliae]|uniref:Restriction endonuclease n=1 Tax=Brasilonema bromeliae SPC951 TaxID=385972 RepID=A0ABX1PEN0_9CYAN|nr:NgoPII family restriction endonuclease [Brasilonema bromeliae]NMG22051.1 restriction endonuclease [Brasilonema bromeliae SPC951]